MNRHIRDTPVTVSANTSTHKKTTLEIDDHSVSHDTSRDDDSAFWQCWEQHEGYLYKRCLQWMGGNHADAEDALSSAMVKALDGMSHRNREIVNVRSWLTRLIHNHCVDIQRSRQRLPISLPNVDDIPVCSEHIEAHSEKSPESSVVAKEMYRQFASIVDDLPTRLRETIVLRFLKDMSYQDISDYLSISNDNVRKRIQQGRAIVRARLDEYL